MNRVEQFVRMSQEKDELEWEQFAAEGYAEYVDLEDVLLELESRLNWLWDEMTQKEREQVEELL